MTDVHLIHVGHFDKNRFFAEPAVDVETGLAMPRVSKPLDTAQVLLMASKVCPDEARRDSWNIWLHDGMLTMNHINDRVAFDFLKELLAHSKCDVVDGNMRLMSMTEIFPQLTEEEYKSPLFQQWR